MMSRSFLALGIVAWLVGATLLTITGVVKADKPWYSRLIHAVLPGFEREALSRVWRIVQIIGGIWIVGGLGLDMLAGWVTPRWIITVLAYLLWVMPPLILLWYAKAATKRPN